MDFIVQYQWEIFITAEVLSIITLLLFGVTRYFLGKRGWSNWFLIAFLVLLILEALIAILVYQRTGSISDFQIVVMIFVLYACTFGISDFKKLDRWMRKKIGKWRGVQLLSEQEIARMNQQKDPKYIARKYRYSSLIHLILFVGVQTGFWIYGTGMDIQLLDYVTDLSWVGTDDVTQTPYANEALYEISMLWGIIFLVDFIWSWSYTIFPAKG